MCTHDKWPTGGEVAAQDVWAPRLTQRDVLAVVASGSGGGRRRLRMAAGDLPGTLRSICNLASCLLLACKSAIGSPGSIISKLGNQHDQLPRRPAKSEIRSIRSCGHPRALPTP